VASADLEQDEFVAAIARFATGPTLTRDGTRTYLASTSVTAASTSAQGRCSSSELCWTSATRRSSPSAPKPWSPCGRGPVDEFVTATPQGVFTYRLLEALAVFVPPARAGPQAQEAHSLASLAGRDCEYQPRSTASGFDSFGRKPRPQPRERQELSSLSIHQPFRGHSGDLLSGVRRLRGSVHAALMEGGVDLMPPRCGTPGPVHRAQDIDPDRIEEPGRDGEIFGIRDALKRHWASARAGSSPAPGTMWRRETPSRELWHIPSVRRGSGCSIPAPGSRWPRRGPAPRAEIVVGFRESFFGPQRGLRPF
jgi:hypothetical protein